MIELKRAADKGWTCVLAERASQLWEWVDKRQIDRHLVSLAILYGTIKVLEWAMGFAAENDGGKMSGIEMAAVIGSVTAPYMALQAAAIKFYFDARKE